MAELTQEEYEALSPSDRAHYDIKGRLGDGLSTEDTDATKTARAAAFRDTNPQADDSASRKETASALEDAKRDAGVSEDPNTDTEGVAGREAAGVGTGKDAQTDEEASAVEEARREEMSEAERAEAETRDRVAAGSDPVADAGVPNVGSPDVEGRENANDEVESGQRFGTDENERTTP